MTQAVEQTFAAYAERHGTGYRLTWDMAQERVRRVVTAVLADDCGAAASGFVPFACEVEAKGTLPDGTVGMTVSMRGRLDRVDRHPVSVW